MFLLSFCEFKFSPVSVFLMWTTCGSRILSDCGLLFRMEPVGATVPGLESGPGLKIPAPLSTDFKCFGAELECWALTSMETFLAASVMTGFSSERGSGKGGEKSGFVPARLGSTDMSNDRCSFPNWKTSRRCWNNFTTKKKNWLYLFYILVAFTTKVTELERNRRSNWNFRQNSSLAESDWLTEKYAQGCVGGTTKMHGQQFTHNPPWPWNTFCMDQCDPWKSKF